MIAASRRMRYSFMNQLTRAKSLSTGRCVSHSYSVGLDTKPSIRIWVSPSSNNSVETPNQVTVTSDGTVNACGAGGRCMSSIEARSRHSSVATSAVNANTAAMPSRVRCTKRCRSVIVTTCMA